MSYNEWLRKCVKNNLSIEQLLFLNMIRLKDFVDPKSWANQYLNKVGRFSKEKVLDPMVERGFLMNLNQPGEFYPEFYVVTDNGEAMFATYAMGEELWEAFPKTLPISGGGRFVSRAGIEKDELIELYLRQIEHDPKTHFDAMRRMMIYARKVNRGEINGCKIGDFVKQKLWEIIEPNELEGSSKFGKDL